MNSNLYNCIIKCFFFYSYSANTYIQFWISIHLHMAVRNGLLYRVLYGVLKSVSKGFSFQNSWRLKALSKVRAIQKTKGLYFYKAEYIMLAINTENCRSYQDSYSKVI